MTTGSVVEQLKSELAHQREFVDEKISAGVAPLREEIDRMAKAYSELQAEYQEWRRSQIGKVDSFGRFVVRDGRFASFDLVDLKMLEHILAGVYGNKGREWIGSKSWRSIQDARTAIVKSLDIESFLAWEENALKRASAGQFDPRHPAMYMAKGSIGEWKQAFVTAYTRALDSTTAGSGDELVPTFESAELWMDVNLDTLVLPLLPQTTMPTNPYQVPTQLGALNWYPGQENIAAITTTPATNRVTLTAQALRGGVPFSDELEEDSIIALIPELRRSLARNAAEVIDDVLLNADTTVTNGINSDGATIATNTAGKAHWLLGFDGIIHQAIVDASATVSVSHATAITAAAFNTIQGRLGKYGVARRRGEVVFLSDPRTHIAARAIPEVETLDTAGGRATMSTGELSVVYGNPYIVSDQMKIADTDGKVTDSGGNTVGRILCFNTSQWRVGFRRQITMETEREAAKGQTTLYTSLRIALTERSGTRSTATHTSISYNITGV